jgi:hypothetical protein
MKILIGLVFALVVVVALYTFNGGELYHVFHPGEIIGIILVPLGLVYGSYGYRGVAVCSSIFNFIFTKAVPSVDEKKVLSCWIFLIYKTSFVLFVLSLIVTLRFIEADAKHIGEMLQASLSPFVYAFIMCEIFLRLILDKENEKPA